ncbi:hypothetical protein ACIRS4_38250, partial [Streptomyces sp. NPDC101166]
MTALVCRLVEDDRLREQTAATAVRSVRDRSWAAVNDLLIRHYREVIAERAQPDSALRSDPVPGEVPAAKEAS